MCPRAKNARDHAAEIFGVQILPARKRSGGAIYGQNMCKLPQRPPPGTFSLHPTQPHYAPPHTCTHTYAQLGAVKHDQRAGLFFSFLFFFLLLFCSGMLCADKGRRCLRRRWQLSFGPGREKVEALKRPSATSPITGVKQLNSTATCVHDFGSRFWACWEVVGARRSRHVTPETSV